MVPPQDLKLLAEIGMHAALRGHGRTASAIFDAMEMCRPDHGTAAVGHAVCALGRGECQRAIEILSDPALAARRGHGAARSLLFFALRLAGRQNEAERLRRAIEAGPDASAKQAVRVISTLCPKRHHPRPPTL
ncbi:MAG TPA: hypothetical protein VFO41_02870 [Alphaproteobacteria bacterium]|nr:hypothetical protein [Alphaproteobacteria bacterium]